MITTLWEYRFYQRRTYAGSADVKSPHTSALGWATGAGNRKSKRVAGSRWRGWNKRTCEKGQGVFLKWCLTQKQGDYQNRAVQLRLFAVPQEEGWDHRPLHLVEVEVDPHWWAVFWHHLLPSSWCSVKEQWQFLELSHINFSFNLFFGNFQSLLASLQLGLNAHANVDLDSLPLFEAEVQFRCCALRSLQFCKLTFLFHPPSITDRKQSINKKIFNWKWPSF